MNGMTRRNAAGCSARRPFAPPILLKPFLCASVATLAMIAGSGEAFAQSSPSPYTTGYRYDAANRLTGVISPDPDGAGPLRYPAVRNSYDRAGRLIGVETGELAVWASESVAPSSWGTGFKVLKTVELELGPLDRKMKEAVRGSDGAIVSLTQYSYTNLGLLECTAVRMNPAAFANLPSSACTLGPQGSFGPDRITKSIYDAAGQLLQVRSGVGTSVEAAEATYSYTPNGKREYVIDANGNRAQLTYDGHDRPDKWMFPSKTRPAAYDDSSPARTLATAGSVNAADFEQYGHDANGNRTSLRRRDGSTLAYQYDALNRMTVKVVPSRPGLSSAQTRDIYYGYDLEGHLLKARFDGISGADGITNDYNGFGELASASISMGGISKTLAYAHDREGHRTELTHADGQKFTYSRDGLGRVSNIHEGTSLTSTSRLIQYQYDQTGNIDWAQRGVAGSAFKADLTFDAAGRLATMANDAPGTANDLTIGGALTPISYNPAGQIVSQVRSNDTYSWTGAVAVNRSYTTNGLNQYTAAGPASFCYDANGNLTADGTSVYKYDVENRLVEKRAQTSSTCPTQSGGYTGTLQASLSYDPMGRLWQVTGPTSSTRLLYDGDELVAEYDSAGTLSRRYVHADNVDDPVVQYDGASVGPSQRTFLMSDERGSIAGLMFNDGTSRAKNSYDEYGIPAATNQGRFQYTGQIWIPELGMYHYKGRLYSPTLGRFLQTDPIGYDDQINLYAYVRNDPVNVMDPTGLCGTRDDEGNCLVTLLPGSEARERAAAAILQDRLNIMDKKVNALDDSGTYSYLGADGNSQTVSNADYKKAWNSQNWAIGTKQTVEAANGGANGGLGGTTPGRTNLMADAVADWGTGAATHPGGSMDAGVDMLIQHEMGHAYGPGLDSALANPVSNSRWNLVAEKAASQQGAAQTKQIEGIWICRFAPSGCQ